MALDIPTFITSPIPQLLASNSVPSDDERDATHEFIGRLQNTITAIDGEVVYLRSLLVGKERVERCAVHEVIYQHKAVLGPVRTLAPELLAEIFLHTLPSDTLDLYPVPEHFNPWKIPLLVSQISRKWRNVALGTPRLWCTLRIFFKFRFASSDTLSDSYVALISLWASRSGTCDLGVCLDYHDASLQFSSLALRPLTDLCHRWRKVVLIFSPSLLQTIRTQFFGRLEGRMPNLEELSLISTHSFFRPPPSINSVFDNFHTNPNLRRLCLHVEVPSSELTLPLQQLTTLHLYTRLVSVCATINNCLEILGNSPNLVEFRAQCGSVDPAVRLPEPVYHHNLQTLQIIAPKNWSRHQRSRGDLQVLFERLTLPALEYLDVYVHKDRHLDDCSFSGFLHRTGRGLLKVGIKGVAFEHIINYLYLTPLAAEVDIKVDTIDDEDFYKFGTERTMSTSMSEVPVPRLKHLKISGGIHFTQEAFLGFLKARWRPEDQGAAPLCQLQSVEVFCDMGGEHLHAETPNILSYREQGLSIRIHSNN